VHLPYIIMKCIKNYAIFVPISVKTGQNSEMTQHGNHISLYSIFKESRQYQTIWTQHKAFFMTKSEQHISGLYCYLCQDDDKSAIQFLSSAYQDFNQSCLYLKMSNNSYSELLAVCARHMYLALSSAFMQCVQNAVLSTCRCFSQLTV
jgi:hypothetical protein